MGMSTSSASPRPTTAPAVSSSVLLVLTSIVSLQVGAVLAVVAFADLAPVTVACVRMILAAVFLLVATRPRKIRARLRDSRGRWLAVWLGVALAVMHVCIYEAIARVPIGLATTLEAFGPLAFAALLSLRRKELVCTGLALAGVLLAAHPSGSGQSAGIALGILAGACWAAYIALNKRCSAQFEDTLGLSLGFVVGGVLLLPAAVVGLASQPLTAHSALVLPVIAVLSSALPFALESRALRTISEYLMSMLTSLYPAVGALLGYLLLGQRLSTGQLVGMALVVLASVGALRARRSR
jgi:inner membrane transporter RhtA